MLDHHRRRRRAERGQSIVEFAIVAVPLLLLLLGILQFAYIYNAQIGLTNGVRAVARFGSSLTANTDGTAGTAASATYANLTGSLDDYVRPFAASRLASGTQVCFEPYQEQSNGAPGGTRPAVRVRVTAVYDHPLLVPIVGSIIDLVDGAANGSYRITSTIELRVDNPIDPAPAVGAGHCTP